MTIDETPNTDGIRFECRRCGQCCRDQGEETHVFLRQGDLESLSDGLAMSPREFAASFVISVEGHLCLASYQGDCIFLDEKTGCRVYSARPLQCRTWPFWPQNMDAGILLAEVQARCPGVGSGPLINEAVIERSLGEIRTTPLLGSAENIEEV